MTLQDQIWLITLLGLGVVTLGFLFVIVRAGKPADPQQAQRLPDRVRTIRRWLFLALVVLGIGVAWATLNPFPIPKQQVSLKTPQAVDVIGYQWRWELSRNQVEAGTPVEFRVTSADVNHGFALYAPDGRIVIQTQAMPGYTNRLLYTFREPGRYRILCMEYCGLVHHAMITEIEVVAAGGDPS